MSLTETDRETIRREFGEGAFPSFERNAAADLTACPECGGHIVFQWALGWLPHTDADGVEHRHDPNLRHCYGCGHRWFVACPVCGETR